MLSIGCNTIPSPEYLNGTWEIVSLRHDLRNVIQINDDSISIPNYFSIQTQLVVPLELTPDSLNIPNPCVKERYAYQLINDTFYIDSIYIMHRLKNITSKQLFYNTHLEITLEEDNTNFKNAAIKREQHSIYIGRQRNKKVTYPSYFSNDYCLVSDGIFYDSLKVEEWLNYLKTNSEEAFDIVFYKDKNCPPIDYKNFIYKIRTTLGKKGHLFESYFDDQAEYFLSIKEIN
jgi:hypothetical protein